MFMQPRNPELVQQIIGIQGEIMPLLTSYKDLLSKLDEEGAFQEIDLKRNDKIAAEIMRYYGTCVDFKYRDHPSNRVLEFMSLIDRTRKLLEDARDGKIDEQGHVMTDLSKRVPITFEDEPPKIVPVAKPRPREEPVPPANLDEVYAIIDDAINKSDRRVMESLEEALEEIQHHATEKLKDNSIRREGIEVKGELEFSDSWEGTITATISLLGAFQAITNTRIPDPIQKEVDQLEEKLYGWKKSDDDEEE